MNKEKEIETWLNNEMTAGERSDFESRLALDPDLSLAVAQHQKLMNDLRDIGLRRKIQAASTANRRLLWRRKVVLVLFMITILGILWFISRQWMQQVPDPAEKVPVRPPIENPGMVPLNNAPQYIKTAPPIAQGPKPPQKGDYPVYRSGENADASVDSTRLSLFETAFGDYRPAIAQSGSFSKALKTLEAGKMAETRAALSSRSQNDTAQYLLAIVALKTHHPENATRYLTNLYRENSPFKPEAEWLLGLKWLLQGKDEDAERAFRAVAAKAGHPHQAAALRILKEMKN